MTIIKQFVFAFALICFSALLVSAQAQSPRVSTVNVTPESNKVHISIVGEVFDMRAMVSDEAGEVVFESGPFDGQSLDWTMSDAQGQRVPAGTYTLTVTYRTSSGKLRRRVEQVLVSEETPSAPTALQAAQSPTTTSVTTGRIAKFTSPSTIGDSVMTERLGRIGINNTVPPHALSVNGGPGWTSSGWIGSLALPSAGAIGWGANSAGSRQGIGHSNGGLFFFRTGSNPGTTGSPAIYDLTINDTGSVGIGTTNPDAKLSITATGNGARVLQLGTERAWVFRQLGTGAGTALELTGAVPTNNNKNFVINTDGNVGIDTGTGSPQAKLDVNGNGSTSMALRIANGGIQVAGAGLGAKTPVFIHQATASNIGGPFTYINHPLTNGDPNAILIVTHNLDPGGHTPSVENNHLFGVVYVIPAAKWAIFNLGGADIPVGAAFNILVVKP